jgi:hypothetical protein|tara:strand:- start:161 stop:343 length:183 start_codon:yes stop_codon:yes gene_type:complete
MKITINEKANTMTVTLPLTPGPSKSGKSMVIASTRGNQTSTATYDGKPVTVGLNAYTAIG